MPEHASHFAGLYDQQNENRIPDWGGDELFTRMPSPPAVDDAPAPRFRPSLVLVDAPEEGRRTPPGNDSSGPRDRRRRRSDEAMRERADRLGISVVESDDASVDVRTPNEPDESPVPEPATESPGTAAARRWEAEEASSRWDGALEPPPEHAPNGRRTTLITGRPDGAPRPLALVPADRRRPRRTPSEWIGARPERIVAWAFVLGLLLILIAISTADAATL
jgi:hypothetical protein